jgi:hypothetical protein
MEQRRLLRAICSSKNEDIQVQTLDWALSGKVRKQDAMYVIRDVAALGGQKGPSNTWNYLKKNWKKLSEFLHGGAFNRINDVVCGYEGSLTEHSFS